MSTILDEHRRYLADEPRLEAFRRAIFDRVKPGDVVLDLGAGTGILGLLAAEAGAARVYSVEATALIELTRQIASANGVRDRFRFLRELSTSAQLPEKVDVVVADQIGGFGFEAGLFQFFADARRRLLTPAGCTIPSKVELWAAPVETSDVRAKIDFWGQPTRVFDVSPVTERAVNSSHPAVLQREDLLAPPVLLLSADPTDHVLDPWRLEATFTVVRPGTLDGIGGWFSAELAPGVHLTNSPLSVNRIDRSNVFFPVDRALAVGP
ncbi:MAG: class I SAM-dependent methyltransferase, partial [Acidimicrobiales bacterium]